MGGHVKAILPVSLLCPAGALAQDQAVQDKGIPLSTTLNNWDVRYRELEPRLERHLAGQPDSLDIMDDLARVYLA